MAQFEYKVVPAPSKSLKNTGEASSEARFAATVAQSLNGEARQGWEFVRAETLPQDERSGLTGTVRVFRTVLIYRRPVQINEAQATREALKLLEDNS